MIANEERENAKDAEVRSVLQRRFADVAAVLVVAGIVASGTRGHGECYRACIVRRFSLPFVPRTGRCSEKHYLIYCQPHSRRLATLPAHSLRFQRKIHHHQI